MYTNTQFSELTLYLREETRGQQVAVKVFHFEVCGQESVATVTGLTMISRKWMQESGTNFY